MMRTLLFAILIFGTVGFISAQDAHLSQYYASPVHLNPAMTGVFDGQYRANISYRDQLYSVAGAHSYKTMAASVDLRYHVVNEDFYAIGFKVLRDEAGNGNYNTTSGHMSLSFMKQISSDSYKNSSQFLVGGVQAGFGQNSIDWNELWFGNQFNTGSATINPDITTSGESGIIGNSGRSPMYLDINAGILWYSVFNENNSIYFGAAGHHINRPNISLFEGSSELPTRWTFHGGGQIGVSETVSFLPSALFMLQGVSRQFNIGTNLRFSHNDWNEIAVRVGIWDRFVKSKDGFSNDALIYVAAVELGRFTVGASYDGTTRDLTGVNNHNGAFEISVEYQYPITKRKYKVSCPTY